MIEGERVTPEKPIKDYQEQWLLPGETAYLLEIRETRARVRCPASGADMWLNLDQLTSLETDDEQPAEEWNPGWPPQ